MSLKLFTNAIVSLGRTVCTTPNKQSVVKIGGDDTLYYAEKSGNVRLFVKKKQQKRLNLMHLHHPTTQAFQPEMVAWLPIQMRHSLILYSKLQDQSFASNPRPGNEETILYFQLGHP